MPASCSDGEVGDRRVRLIMDYLILLDGELQHLAHGAERNLGADPGKLLGQPRRRAADRNGAG